MPDAPAITPAELAKMAASASESVAIVDSEAKKEGIAIAEGRYDDKDAEDSYGIRSALKGQIKCNASLLFFTIYGVFTTIIMAMILMAGCYIYYLSWVPEKMGAALGAVATHAMATIIGLLGTAYYGKIKRK